MEKTDITRPLIEGIESLVKIIIEENHNMRDLQEWGIDNGIPMDNEGVIDFSGFDFPTLQEIYFDLEVLAFGEQVSEVVYDESDSGVQSSYKQKKKLATKAQGKSNTLTARETMHRLEKEGIEGADILADAPKNEKREYKEWCKYLLTTYLALNKDLIGFGNKDLADYVSNTVINPLKQYIANIKSTSKPKASADNSIKAQKRIINVRRILSNKSSEYIAVDKSGNVVEDNFKSLEEAVDYAMEHSGVVSIREGNIGRQGKEVWRKRTGYVGASGRNARRVKASMTAEDAANYFTQYANYMDDAAAMEFLLPAFEKIQAEVDIDWGNISDSINQVIYDNLNKIAENPSVLAFMEDSGWEEEALHEYLSEKRDFIISDYDSFLDMLDIPEEMQRNSYLFKGIYDDVRDDYAFYEINGYANGFDEVDLDDYKDDVDNEDWDSLDDWDKVERIRDAGYEVDTGAGWWEWANEVGGDDWETKLHNLQDLNEAAADENGWMYFDNSVGRYIHPNDVREWYQEEAFDWKLEQEL